MTGDTVQIGKNAWNAAKDAKLMCAYYTLTLFAEIQLVNRRITTVGSIYALILTSMNLIVLEREVGQPNA